MKGAHGLQPEVHEHVHCRFCGANGVHVETPANADQAALGLVVYGPHARKGSTVKCLDSRTQTVDARDRHQGDPR